MHILYLSIRLTYPIQNEYKKEGEIYHILFYLILCLIEYVINDRITYLIPLPTKYKIRYNISSLIVSHAISNQSNMTLGYV